ncbi:MAG: UDP-glycosyltransferase [Ramlibacter sp.]|nr:UDP-glycosyltransferase [Ramlibacter sp.]
MSKPVWLFVAYGGGHVTMVVPVALRARELGLCEPVVLALTTAGPVARAAGLRVVGFSDFVGPQDAEWLALGRQLAGQLSNASVDPAESAAYLGLSMADLAEQRGREQALADYREQGRSAFLPVRFLKRVLRAIQPQLVCATNSPRAERAAILAARELGVPSVCVVDLFAVDEKRWIGRTGFADRVCVLNDAVRHTLLAMERQGDEVVVTGNPAFDRLHAPVSAANIAALRRRMGHPGRRVLLWASQAEPAEHPWRPGTVGNSLLPRQILDVLASYVAARDGWMLAVRPHPSEAPPALAGRDRVVLTGQDWPLAELLHACDAVCVLTSTVGLEAHLLGKPVIQVAGGLFEDAAPFAAMGVARPATLASLEAVLDALPEAPPGVEAAPALATDRVVQVLRDLVP